MMMRISTKRPVGGALIAVLALLATLLGTVPLGAPSAEAQEAPENLALGGTATQSPTRYGGVSSRAIDGNTNGIYSGASVTHTLGRGQDWWQVDLGSSENVGAVTVYNRTDCCQDRLANFYVFVSATDLTGRSLVDIVGDPSVARVHHAGGVAVSQTLQVGSIGRYVRVQRVDVGILSLAEVQVFDAETVGSFASVVNPGDQRFRVGDTVQLPIVYSGSIEVVGLPANFSFVDDEIVGTVQTVGRWPVELRVAGGGATDVAYFDLVVTDGPPPGVVAEHPAIDPRTVSERPMEGGDGVVWHKGNRDSTSTLDITVWDMQQAGDWMYVGGEFKQVIEQGPDGSDGPLHSQPHLARFSIATGKWDPTFRPSLDGNVHALEVSPRGRLLVGGEFTNIDGQPGTQGLAAINPNTGQVDPTFVASVERPWYPQGRAIVRELEVVGDLVYIGGNFSHINGPQGQRIRVNKLTRVGANYGTIDASWKPVVSGGSVWGIGVDQDRGRVYISGRFKAVNGRVEGTTATVDTETGESVTGLAAHVRNAPSRPEMYDVEYAGNRLWAAGSQHVLQLHNADTHEVEAWNHAGNRCDRYCWSPHSMGGDFQFVEKIGDFVYSGCHCTKRTQVTHFSSVTGLRTPHTVAMAYHLDGGLVTEVEFDIGGNVDGGWSAASDDVGCLWLGGDIIDGGFRLPGGRVFARGFARFCDTEIRVPEGLEVAAALESGVRLEWTPVANAKGYAVFRDETYLGYTTESFYVDTTIVPGRTYEYEISSENFAGERSEPSEPVQAVVGTVDVEAPTAPQNLRPVAIGANEVIFEWDASADNLGIDEYLVYRDGAYIGFVPGDETSFTDADRDNFARHSYQVRAVDFNANRSAQSEPLEVQLGGLDTEDPSAPQNLRVEATTESSLEIGWDASTDNAGVDGYVVIRDGETIGQVAGDQLSFTDSGLTSFAQHGYRVQAVDAAGNESALSAVLEARVGGVDTEAPSVPQGLVASDITDTSVALEWDASTDNVNVSSYLVYRDGAFIAWRTADVTTYLDTGLAVGTYNYTIRAVDTTSNRSDRSEPLSVTVGQIIVDVEAPSVPQGLVASNVTDSTVEIEWNASTDNVAVASYLVYRDGGFVQWVAGDITSFEDSGLATGNYTYEVRSTDGADNRSEASAPLQVQVGAADTQAPSVPQNVTEISVTDTSVELGWDASTDDFGVASYLILRDGAFVAWVPADTTSYIDSGLSAGTYAYQVRAVDTAGNRSERSAERVVLVGAADTEPPAAPQNLAASPINDTSVEITWDRSTDNVGVTSYLVYRDGAFIGWTPADVTSYVDAGLNAGDYTYSVRAVDAEGNRSDPPSSVDVRVGAIDVEPPSVPLNLALGVVTNTSVEVRWDPSSDNVSVRNYLVYRNGGYVGWSPGTSYVDNGLTVGQTYQYTVRAVDTSDIRSDVSLPVEATPA